MPVVTAAPGNVVEQWTILDPGCYQVKVVVIQEEDGYSAHAARLPGVVGQGDTVDDAVASIASGLDGALREYLSSGDIPWTNNSIEGNIAAEKWILVNV